MSEVGTKICHTGEERTLSEENPQGTPDFLGDPRPAPEDYRPPIEEQRLSLTVGEVLGLVKAIRLAGTEGEAQAFVAGYVKGREAA
jgi:hypothetical protein